MNQLNHKNNSLNSISFSLKNEGRFVFKLGKGPGGNLPPVFKIPEEKWNAMKEAKDREIENKTSAADLHEGKREYTIFNEKPGDLIQKSLTEKEKLFAKHLKGWNDANENLDNEIEKTLKKNWGDSRYEKLIHNIDEKREGITSKREEQEVALKTEDEFFINRTLANLSNQVNELTGRLKDENLNDSIIEMEKEDDLAFAKNMDDFKEEEAEVDSKDTDLAKNNVDINGDDFDGDTNDFDDFDETVATKNNDVKKKTIRIEARAKTKNEAFPEAKILAEHKGILLGIDFSNIAERVGLGKDYAEYVKNYQKNENIPQGGWTEDDKYSCRTSYMKTLYNEGDENFDELRLNVVGETLSEHANMVVTGISDTKDLIAKTQHPAAQKIINRIHDIEGKMDPEITLHLLRDIHFQLLDKIEMGNVNIGDIDTFITQTYSDNFSAEDHVATLDIESMTNQS